MSYIDGFVIAVPSANKQKVCAESSITLNLRNALQLNSVSRFEVRVIG
jgi:uncharacterized protein YbaA (DUF1428 family)